jgi:capsular exopolysaccharide synthesis family protein
MLSIPQIGTIFLNTQADTPVISSESRTITSESIRILRSQLISMGTNTSKAFLITSMDSGEGKSYCSFNIATSLALLKKKTILVNMDLRTTNKIYNHLENCLGVGAYLDDLIGIPDIIVSTEQPCLDYIPAGDSSKYYSELFRDNKIAELLDFLRVKYEYIIIDSSPLGKLADALIVSRYTNFNLIIVRPDHTIREQLLELEQMYTEGRIGNIGIVLNGKKMEKKDRSRYYIQPSASKKRKKKITLI